LNALIAFAAALLVTAMPFPCKICSNPSMYFLTKETNYEQSYFANILTTLSEKPLRRGRSNKVLRVTVAPSFELPYSKMFSFNRKNITVLSKTLIPVSRVDLPKVVEKNQFYNQNAVDGQKLNRLSESIVRVLKSSSKKTIDEYEEDGSALLIEVIDDNSKEYFFRTISDSDSTIYSSAMELMTY